MSWLARKLWPQNALHAQETEVENSTANDNEGAQESLSLCFHAVVEDGEGRFSRMSFPGRNELLAVQSTLDASENHRPHPQWPVKLFDGSMNCRITSFPDEFAAVAYAGDRIAALDTGHFTPAFSIPRAMIAGNNIRPYGADDNQRKGIAQVWRCAVTNENTGATFQAWHVRRVDGTYPKFHEIIELMSDVKMRKEHGLESGTPIKIEMFKGAAFNNG
jgi:hypothetical protein